MKKEKDKKAAVQMTQLIIWVTLIFVEMTAVHCLQVRAEVREIQKEVVYEQVGMEEILPETVTVDVEWESEIFFADCISTDKQIVREYWKDDFSFPVTFHMYGSDYYELGDKRIPYNESKPQLQECYGELLSLIGVSDEEYIIDDIVWDGEHYMDEQGENCRNAVALGRRLLRDWRVFYTGSVELPERRAISEEMAEEEKLVEYEEKESEFIWTVEEVWEEPESVVINEPTKKVDSIELSPPSLWQKITKTLLVGIGIGVILFFGGLAFLGLVQLVKVIRLCYTDRKEKRDTRRNNHVHRK